MDVLTGAYPRFYAPGTDMRKQIAVWASQFADDDPGLVLAAVNALIATDVKGYPPHIGAVKEQMRKISVREDMSEAEAWGHIRKAIRNSGYEAIREYDCLPPILRKLVGSPSQLREWAMMDSEVLNTVVASNVQRGFRTMKAREQEQAKLPRGVKGFIAGLSRQFSLTDGTETKGALQK